ncbi:MAG TPA: amidase, partial [Hyphomicrobiales bacterium]|nr:amidase [Hyphomicrobiales bacterium]
MTDPSNLTLAEAAAAIRERKLSSVEMTEALLTRIDLWQDKLNAFVRLDRGAALREATEADAELARGELRGPLHGVPLAHKDMYYRSGELAECGSKIRAGWRAPATSTALARLAEAGALYLGALHMSEFAYGPTGHNAYLGHARNPWAPDRVTGGSSSGSGAAVAARLTPAALGSDTGGSIRLPAHFCGITGLKPTNNRVSRANAMPLSFTLDSVGPLAQTAEDCGLILKIVGGPDPLDPVTFAAPQWSEAQAASSPKGLKIGIPKSFYLEDLTPEVAQTVDETILTLRSLGCTILEVDLPDQTLLSAAAIVVLTVE